MVVTKGKENSFFDLFFFFCLIPNKCNIITHFVQLNSVSIYVALHQRHFPLKKETNTKKEKKETSRRFYKIKIMLLDMSLHNFVFLCNCTKRFINFIKKKLNVGGSKSTFNRNSFDRGVVNY